MWVQTDDSARIVPPSLTTKPSTAAVVKRTASPGGTSSSLATSAGKAMGLELEGLSQEDQEFEVARQFVRFAGEAAKNTAAASQSAPPATAANKGTVAAAKKHAPGLLRPSDGNGTNGRRSAMRSGRWIRRGNTIILFGA